MTDEGEPTDYIRRLVDEGRLRPDNGVVVGPEYDRGPRTWTYRAPDPDELTAEEREDVEAIREQLREWTPDDDNPSIGGGPVMDHYLEDVRLLLDLVDRLAPAVPDDPATMTIETDAE